ncbi:hypothetical protein D3H55_01890 [Bacillus salacetis]|uniref:Uncharacterized protein n=1 Tax=Bacillus salacetis TaxID=2315464 RepID=A0A3A1R763_9BACI|nr:hypothetical protein [Bacillus salacetis]RIW38317.1 hypothetical protein D3H55_01890 [Bacillus salacetis]
MIFIFLFLLTGALFINFVQKYILRIKDPDIKELWLELDEQGWYRELKADPEVEDFLEVSKFDGLLKDPYYVRKIIDNEGHRTGFINYVKQKTAE